MRGGGGSFSKTPGSRGDVFVERGETLFPYRVKILIHAVEQPGFLRLNLLMRRQETPIRFDKRGQPGNNSVTFPL